MKPINITKYIDDFINYTETIYGIKLYSYQKVLLKMMWTKEYIKNLVIPRHANITTDNLINICRFILDYKN